MSEKAKQRMRMAAWIGYAAGVANTIFGARAYLQGAMGLGVGLVGLGALLLMIAAITDGIASWKSES